MKQLELARRELKQNREYNNERFFNFDTKMGKLGKDISDIKSMLRSMQKLQNKDREAVDVGEKPSSNSDAAGISWNDLDAAATETPRTRNTQRSEDARGPFAVSPGLDRSFEQLELVADEEPQYPTAPAR
jgi:hypothetical protein